MTINQRILELRKEKGVSQQTVADAVGISQSTVAKIEINRNEATASTIKKLADYFNVSADYILGRTDELGNMITPIHSPTTPDFSAKEKEILRLYNGLNPSGKELIEQTLKTLSNSTAGNADSKKKA